MAKRGVGKDPPDIRFISIAATEDEVFALDAEGRTYCLTDDGWFRVPNDDCRFNEEPPDVEPGEDDEEEDEEDEGAEEG